MSQGSLIPKIRFLGQKVCPVAGGQTDRHIIYKEKNRKMPIKSVKMEISKNKKMFIFLMSQESFNQKIRFLGQKVCPVARRQTDGHESDYMWAPFQGLRTFSFNLSSRIDPI